MYKITLRSLMSCLGLLLAGCQNDSTHKMAKADHYDYTADFANCVPSDPQDQTINEHEHDCARRIYEAKKDRLNTLFSEVSEIYEQRAKEHPSEMTREQLDKLMSSQQQFVKWVKKNSKLTNAGLDRDYPYHYYGTMTDYINLRMKHLQNLKREIKQPY